MNSHVMNLLAFFGLDEDDVISIDSAAPDKGVCHVHVRMRPKFGDCPKCGEPHPYRYGLREVHIKNSVVNGTEIVFHLSIQRYRCRKCGTAYKDVYPLYGKKERISKVVVSSIVRELSLPQSYYAIARRYHVSLTEVIRIMDSLGRQPKLSLPRVLCIDEFHFSNGSKKSILGDYPAVISNPYDGTIVDIVESRRLETMREYMRKMSVPDKKNVRVFVSDMHEPYRLIKREFFPNAIHIVDHFHVMKLFSQTMMTMRTRIMKSEREKSHESEYRFLKNSWRLFQKDKASLIAMQRTDPATGVIDTVWSRVEEVLERWQDLGEVFDAKQEFFEFSKRRKKPGDAASWVPFFAQKMSHSTVPELQAIGKTFGKWMQEIINAYTPSDEGRYYSNAIAEANNNSIQTLMDTGYGYANFERFRNRVLMINRSEEAVERRKRIKEAKRNREEKKQKEKAKN